MNIPLLILTRPESASRRVAAALEKTGTKARIVISPALQILPVDSSPPGAPAGLIFTSAHGVEAWQRQGGQTGLPVFAVGDATAQAARQISASVWSAKGEAEALVAGLLHKRPTGPLLHVRGEVSRGGIAQRLTDAGLPTQEWIAYRQTPCAPSAQALAALNATQPVILPLYSPRSASIVSAWPIKAPLLVAALSQAVALACDSDHIESVTVATRPEAEPMLKVITQLIAQVEADMGQVGEA